MSELSTKKNPCSFPVNRCSAARPIGPAVPIGSRSIKHLISTLYCKKVQKLGKNLIVSATQDILQMTTYLFFVLFNLLLHDDLLIVDRQKDLSDSCLGQTLDLVAKERFVCEFDKWLGHSECERSEPVAIATD